MTQKNEKDTPATDFETLKNLFSHKNYTKEDSPLLKYKENKDFIILNIFESKIILFEEALFEEYNSYGIGGIYYGSFEKIETEEFDFKKILSMEYEERCDYFKNTLNDFLEDPFFDSDGECSEGGETLTSEEQNKIFEKIQTVLYAFGNKIKNRTLYISSSGEYNDNCAYLDEDLMYPGITEDKNLQENIISYINEHILCDYVYTEWTLDYNDGASNRRSGYSQNNAHFELDFSEPTSHERIKARQDLLKDLEQNQHPLIQFLKNTSSED